MERAFTRNNYIAKMKLRNINFDEMAIEISLKAYNAFLYARKCNKTKHRKLGNYF